MHWFTARVIHAVKDFKADKLHPLEVQFVVSMDEVVDLLMVTLQQFDFLTGHPQEPHCVLVDFAAAQTPYDPIFCGAVHDQWGVAER